MPNQLRAIVVDANAFGRRAEPNIDVIISWVDACAEHDAELWIPEVVAWEMAEHVLTAALAADEALTAYNRRRRKWGFQPFDEVDPITVEGVLENLIEIGAVLVPLDGESARTAVQDQVLQTGPGSRKNDVKTGVADSAWLRSVRRHNGGSFDGLILVTADSGATAAASRMFGGDPPRVARSLNDLRPMLDEEQDANEQQLHVFVDTVNERLPDTNDLLYAAGIDKRNWWSPQELDANFHFEWEQQESAVSAIEPVELVDGGTYDAWSDSIRGRVRIPVSVEEQYARQDAWGDAPEYTMVGYKAWIDADVTVYLNSQTERAPTLDDEFEDVELEVDETSFDMVPI